MTDIKPYPQWVLDMLEPQGFIERFWYNLGKHDFDTYADIYRITEMEYEHYFDKRRYKTYKSFHQALSKYVKKSTTKG